MNRRAEQSGVAAVCVVYSKFTNGRFIHKHIVAQWASKRSSGAANLAVL